MRGPDAIVVGGGPAGAATAVWLARWGHRVTVVEREHCPRLHVAEWLIPGVNDLLAELGVADAIDRAGFQVLRSRFDEIRLDHASAPRSRCSGRRSSADGLRPPARDSAAVSSPQEGQA